MLQKFINVIIIGTILILGAISVLYLKELKEPISTYFKFYGNVTVTESIEYDNEVESYTFGWSPGPLEIKFINQLWCRPLGSMRNHDLIATRIKVYPEYTFSNTLPGVSVLAIEKDDKYAMVGLQDREKIRKAALETNDYYKWSLGQIFPPVTSECYITVDVTTYTEIFRIEKTLEFIGHDFIYRHNC